MSSLLPAFKKSAQKSGIYICTGSLAIQTGAGLQNTSFLIGPTGKVLLSCGSKFKAYGHSMVVSPWGDVLVEAGEGKVSFMQTWIRQYY